MTALSLREAGPPPPSGDGAPSPTSTTGQALNSPSALLASLTTRSRTPGTAALARTTAPASARDTTAGPNVPGTSSGRYAPDTPDAPGSRYVSTGTANTATDRPIRRKDRFRIGSITKSFTAVVVLQLAAERRLALDDTVEQHLPGVIRGHGNDGRDLTLRQLLTHTSGLFSYTDALGTHTTTFDRAYTPASLLRTALAHRPLFAPGTDWSYSNTNYTVLGMVIEKVTGRSYAEEAQRRILTPLRLTGTSFPGDSSRLPAPHGRAYSGTPASPKDVTAIEPSGAGAAGEVISTLDDLDRFYSALLTGELLPAAQLAEMRNTDASGGVYGMGLMRTELSCTTVWGHNGRIIGSYAETAATSDGRHVLTYRLNSDWSTDEKLKKALLESEFCRKSRK
ncbi:serine hydrolase domain-containing protein [Streptomyces monticola]|uniref:serine hydrolase domain-containing protein n=1 Tax=Streptomyces monticola TaxID=2666263 RepID=UPI0036D375E1